MIINQEIPKKANKATTATPGNMQLFLDSTDQSAFFDHHFTNPNEVRFYVTENNNYLDSTVFKKYKKTFFDDWIISEQA